MVLIFFMNQKGVLHIIERSHIFWTSMLSRFPTKHQGTSKSSHYLLWDESSDTWDSSMSRFLETKLIHKDLDIISQIIYYIIMSIMCLSNECEHNKYWSNRSETVFNIFDTVWNWSLIWTQTMKAKKVLWSTWNKLNSNRLHI